MLHVHIAICEVRVAGEICHKIRTQADLDIDSACIEAGDSWSQATGGCIGRQMVETAKSIWLDDKQAPAADAADAMQFTRLTDLIGAERSTPGAPEVFLVLAANESLEVQPPNDVIGMHEIER